MSAPNTFTEKAQEAIVEAQRITSERKLAQLEPDAILAALIVQPDGIVPQVLHKIGVDPLAIHREVEAVIAGHKGDIEDCRARHIREAGKLPDRAVLSFELRPSGRVSNPLLDPPLTDTVFARCLQEAARAWRFPVFTGDPIPVQYPFEWAVR